MPPRNRTRPTRAQDCQVRRWDARPSLARIANRNDVIAPVGRMSFYFTDEHLRNQIPAALEPPRLIRAGSNHLDARAAHVDDQHAHVRLRSPVSRLPAAVVSDDQDRTEVRRSAASNL